MSTNPFDMFDHEKMKKFFNTEIVNEMFKANRFDKMFGFKNFFNPDQYEKVLNSMEEIVKLNNKYIVDSYELSTKVATEFAKK
ncbi:MAG: hypothetical protein GY714_02220 [Desulfobacterales bacterium]|nr:hypothetical protein [Desulfobacterales bacterium]